MRLRHPRRKLTQYKETPAPPWTWGRKLTQWAYLAVLLFLVAYAFYYVGYQMLYFNQRGRVTVQHVVIASARGGRILEEPFGVGACVKKGQLLARVGAPFDCRPSSGDRALRDLEVKNKVDRFRLRGLLDQRRLLLRQLREMKNRRALELFGDSPGGVRELEEKLRDLDGDILLLRRQIRLRTKEIGEIRALARGDHGCGPELIRAPSDGRIVAVERTANEVVMRSTPIMDFVPDDAEVEIRAIFKNDFLESLTLGKEVRIRFPDDSETPGRIYRIESTSVPFSWDHFRKNYIPERTRVLAVIRPLNRHDARVWKAFQEMEVEVMGWR